MLFTMLKGRGGGGELTQKRKSEKCRKSQRKKRIKIPGKMHQKALPDSKECLD